MMNVLVCLLLMAMSAGAAAQCVDDLAIRPGQCIGRICLGMTAAATRAALGRPVRQFSVHGLKVASWHGQSYKRLYVVFEGDSVVEVHANSPAYAVCGPDERVGAGAHLDGVRRAFPQGEEDRYTIFASGKQKLDYIDTRAGITFVVAGDADGPVTMVVVHRSGRQKRVGYSRGDEAYWDLQ